MPRRKFSNPNSKQDPGDAAASSLRLRAADSAWSAQDRARSSLSHGVERLSYPLQKQLIWPLQDRAEMLGSPARGLSFAAVLLLAAVAGIAGLVWAAPDKPSNPTATAAVVSPPPEVKVRAAAEKPAEPTLQGAAPVFEPSAEGASSEVDPAKAIVKSSPPSPTAGASSSSSAATNSSSTAKSAAKEPAVDGPPAGPEAVAVAREFSDAFVVYETGGLDAGVRKAFGSTATPELSKALLRRPPRLPANVEVPRAKVLNVVAGPSHEGVYSVSVSLLRVGVTSELRLDMEQLKGREWRVTNVLG